MKRFYLLIVAGVLFSFEPAGAQDFWGPVTLPEPDLAIYAMNLDNNGLLVIGGNGYLYSSYTMGADWFAPVNWPGYVPKCIGFNSSNHIFVGTAYDGILRSVDGGVTFTEINTGLTFMSVWCILVMNNDDILVGTQGGIFKSTDNGDNWFLFGTGLPADEIRKITINDDGILFCGTTLSGVYRSSDNGATWEACNNGLPANADVFAMKGGMGQGQVYAGIYPEGMFRTFDNGNTWEEINNGLPFTKYGDYVKGIAINDISFFLSLFVFVAVYLYGVYYLDYNGDAGDQWVPVNTGLPPEPSTTCMASGIGPPGQLWLGTVFEGLFLHSEPIPGMTDYLKNETRASVSTYPNPVSQEMTFVVDLPEAAVVSLAVYDPLGQEVKIIDGTNYGSGTYRILWRPDGMKPGIYFYRMNTETRLITGKLVLSN